MDVSPINMLASHRAPTAPTTNSANPPFCAFMAAFQTQDVQQTLEGKPLLSKLCGDTNHTGKKRFDPEEEEADAKASSDLGESVACAVPPVAIAVVTNSDSVPFAIQAACAAEPARVPEGISTAPSAVAVESSPPPLTGAADRKPRSVPRASHGPDKSAQYGNAVPVPLPKPGSGQLAPEQNVDVKAKAAAPSRANDHMAPPECVEIAQPIHETKSVLESTAPNHEGATGAGAEAGLPNDAAVPLQQPARPNLAGETADATATLGMGTVTAALAEQLPVSQSNEVALDATAKIIAETPIAPVPTEVGTAALASGTAVRGTAVKAVATRLPLPTAKGVAANFENRVRQEHPADPDEQHVIRADDKGNGEGDPKLTEKQGGNPPEAGTKSAVGSASDSQTGLRSVDLPMCEAASTGKFPPEPTRSERATVPAVPVPEPGFHSNLPNAGLIARLNHAEWSFGMQTPEFGHIEVRTRLEQQAVSASILVERAETGRLLQMELPSLHRRMSDLDVPVAGISVYEPSAAMSGEGERHSRPQQWNAMPALAETRSEKESEPKLPSLTERMDSVQGLSIRI